MTPSFTEEEIFVFRKNIDSDLYTSQEYRIFSTDITQISNQVLSSITFTPNKGITLYEIYLACESLTGSPTIKLTLGGVDSNTVSISTNKKYLFTFASSIPLNSGTQYSITITLAGGTVQFDTGSDLNDWSVKGVK